MSSFTIPSIFTAIDKYTAPVRKMASATQGFTKKAEVGVAKLDRRLRKLTPSFGGLQKQIVGLASAAVLLTFLNTSAKAVMAYETNIASLSAITGVAGADLEVFKGKVNDVAKATKSSSVEVAKAFELVGSAKPELLKNAEGLAEVTKNAIILSQASGEDLAVSVQSLTGTLNQFELGANKAADVINILAAGSKEGAAAVPQITESLDKFGTVAASMNVSVAQSVGLIETLAEKNIKGAEAGTKLRNVLTKMATAKALPKEALNQLKKFGVNTELVADKTVPLNKRLKELSKIQNDATALAKVFGTENLVAGQVLLQNVDKVEQYTKAVAGTNVAQEQADKNTSTLSARLDQLSNAWTNVLTGSTSATGGLNMFKSLVVFVTDNLETIVGVIGSAVAAFAALKAIVWVTRAGILAYNIAMGISALVTGKSMFALRANTVALTTYNIVSKTVTIATKAWSVAQRILNVILLANPIGLIIAAIFALGAAIMWVVNVTQGWGEQWDEVVGFMQAKLETFKFGALVVWGSISDSFLTMVDNIVLAWKWGMNQIGVLSDAQFAQDKTRIAAEQQARKDAIVENSIGLLKAQQRVNEGIALKVGFKDDEEAGATTTGADGGGELLNPKAAVQEGINSKIEEKSTQEVIITVNDPDGKINVDGGGGAVPVNTTSTVG